MTTPPSPRCSLTKPWKKAHGRSSEHSGILHCITSGNTDVTCTTTGVHSYPPVVIANRAWTDFETSIKAKLQTLNLELKWWSTRNEASRVSPEGYAKATEKITADSTKLSALLPAWAHPVSYKIAASTLAILWREEYLIRPQGRPATPLPHVFPNMVNHRWRLSTCPRPRGDGAPTTGMDLSEGVHGRRSSVGESGE